MLGPNFFDSELTQPKLFQTKRTRRLACLLSFCELVFCLMGNAHFLTLWQIQKTDHLSWHFPCLYLAFTCSNVTTRWISMISHLCHCHINSILRMQSHGSVLLKTGDLSGWTLKVCWKQQMLVFKTAMIPSLAYQGFHSKSQFHFWSVSINSSTNIVNAVQLLIAWQNHYGAQRNLFNFRFIHFMRIK